MKIDRTNLYPLYDQYSNDENKLTHALLHTLGSSDLLLKEFLKRFLGIKSLNKSGTFHISTQKRPKGYGDVNPKEVKSVPDAWIVNETANLGIAIEVKSKRNKLRIGQLKSHANLVKKYKDSYLIAITPDFIKPEKIAEFGQNSELHVKIIWISWGQIYRSFKESIENNSKLSDKDRFILNSMIEYFERRMKVLGFQGISFDKNKGFEIDVAKDILKTEMDELQPFVANLYSDLVKRRPAITMLTKTSVWDCFGNAEGFTNDLHITLGINEESHNIALVVPNSSRKAWNRLKDVFLDDKRQNELITILSKFRKSVPCVYVDFVQRHFITRKKDIVDGRLHFNLDVIGNQFSTKDSKSKVSQIWFPAFKDAIINKKNMNAQVAFITKYFIKDTQGIDQPNFLYTVKNTLENYKPLYEYLKSD